MSNIMFNTQAEVAASAEAQFKQQQQNMQAFVDTVANHAPAGSEAAVSAMQSVVTATSEATRATIEASKKKPLKKHWRLPKATLTQQLPPQTERPDKPLNKSELPQKDKC